MFEIIPGILEKEWPEIEKKINLVKPIAQTIHIDIIDGKFARNSTFLDPKPFKKFSDDIFFELHMMVDEPINYLEKWADAGIKRFLGHIEKMSDQEKFVKKGRALGEVGFAIDGPTSTKEIKVPFDELDSILVYTSDKVGFSGPSFMSERLEKIKDIRKKNKKIPMEVDGGINNLSISSAKDAGATRFISTSFMFNNGNPSSQYSLLLNEIED